MTHEEAFRIVAQLGSAYPAITWTESMLATWCEDIAEFDYAAAADGARRYRRTCTAFPSIAGLRAAILHQELPPLDEILADAQRVFEVTFCGVDKLHPITQRAVRTAGGVDRLRQGMLEYMQRDLERAVRTAYEGASADVVAAGTGAAVLPSHADAVALLGEMKAHGIDPAPVARPESTDEVQEMRQHVRAALLEIEARCAVPEPVELAGEALERRREQLRQQAETLRECA